MTMQDPVADMLTRIRNAQKAKHPHVDVPSSILKNNIARVLKEEGYITDFQLKADDGSTKTLMITLKYFQNQPVIDKIRRVSRPGLRIYKSVKDLKPVSGFGISILSTSQGIMSHAVAKSKNIGGEVICEVA